MGNQSYHWYRGAQRPPEDITVIAQLLHGLDGVIERKLYRRGHRWYFDSTGGQLPEAMSVVRWRFKSDRHMQAQNMAPLSLTDIKAVGR